MSSGDYAQARRERDEGRLRDEATGRVLLALLFDQQLADDIQAGKFVVLADAIALGAAPSDLSQMGYDSKDVAAANDTATAQLIMAPYRLPEGGHDLVAAKADRVSDQVLENANFRPQDIKAAGDAAQALRLQRIVPTPAPRSTPPPGAPLPPSLQKELDQADKDWEGQFQKEVMVLGPSGMPQIGGAISPVERSLGLQATMIRTAVDEYKIGGLTQEEAKAFIDAVKEEKPSPDANTYYRELGYMVPIYGSYLAWEDAKRDDTALSKGIFVFSVALDAVFVVAPLALGGRVTRVPLKAISGVVSAGTRAAAAGTQRAIARASTATAQVVRSERGGITPSALTLTRPLTALAQATTARARLAGRLLTEERGAVQLRPRERPTSGNLVTVAKDISDDLAEELGKRRPNTSQVMRLAEDMELLADGMDRFTPSLQMTSAGLRTDARLIITNIEEVSKARGAVDHMADLIGDVAPTSAPRVTENMMLLWLAGADTAAQPLIDEPDRDLIGLQDEARHRIPEVDPTTGEQVRDINDADPGLAAFWAEEAYRIPSTDVATVDSTIRSDQPDSALAALWQEERHGLSVGVADQPVSKVTDVPKTRPAVSPGPRIGGAPDRPDRPDPRDAPDAPLADAITPSERGLPDLSDASWLEQDLQGLSAQAAERARVTRALVTSQQQGATGAALATTTQPVALPTIQPLTIPTVRPLTTPMSQPLTMPAVRPVTRVFPVKQAEPRTSTATQPQTRTTIAREIQRLQSRATRVLPVLDPLSASQVEAQLNTLEALQTQLSQAVPNTATARLLRQNIQTAQFTLADVLTSLEAATSVATAGSVAPDVGAVPDSSVASATSQPTESAVVTGGARPLMLQRRRWRGPKEAQRAAPREPRSGPLRLRSPVEEAQRAAPREPRSGPLRLRSPVKEAQRAAPREPRSGPLRLRSPVEEAQRAAPREPRSGPLRLRSPVKEAQRAAPREPRSGPLRLRSPVEEAQRAAPREPRSGPLRLRSPVKEAQRAAPREPRSGPLRLRSPVKEAQRAAPREGLREARSGHRCRRSNYQMGPSCHEGSTPGKCNGPRERCGSGTTCPQKRPGTAAAHPTRGHRGRASG